MITLSLSIDGQLPVSSLQKYTTFDEDNTFTVSCFEAILLLSQFNITIQYINIHCRAMTTIYNTVLTKT